MKIAFLLTVLSATSALAFKPDIHKEISENAFDLIRQCAPQADTSDLREGVVQGTSDEDLTEPQLRLRNWHFYNTYGALQNGSWINESLDWIFHYRNMQQMSDPTPGTLGRILHYIQDVHVPAHVVPVFHGGLNGQGDAFDKYQISRQEQQSIVQGIDCTEFFIEIQTAQRVAWQKNLTPIETNLNLLDQSARGTLKEVGKSIGASSVTWSYFWRTPEHTRIGLPDILTSAVAIGTQSKRFGTYVGTFGEETRIFPRGGKLFNVTAEDFKEFYLDQYRRAVMASAKLILLNPIQAP